MHSIHTCSTLPERGSMTRSFLSLQLVASRLPSVLNDIQRITSVWQSIIFTGSPISRFQIRIYRETKNTLVIPQIVFVAVWHSHVHSSQLLIIKINFHMQSNCPHCPCFNFVAQFIEFEAVEKYFITL